MQSRINKSTPTVILQILCGNLPQKTQLEECSTLSLRSEDIFVATVVVLSVFSASVVIFEKITYNDVEILSKITSAQSFIQDKT